MIDFSELKQEVERTLASFGIVYKEEDIEIPNFEVGKTIQSISSFVDDKIVVGKIQRTTVENIYRDGKLRTDRHRIVHVYIDDERYVLGIFDNNEYSISSWQIV